MVRSARNSCRRRLRDAAKTMLERQRVRAAKRDEPCAASMSRRHDREHADGHRHGSQPHRAMLRCSRREMASLMNPSATHSAVICDDPSAAGRGRTAETWSRPRSRDGHSVRRSKCIERANPEHECQARYQTARPRMAPGITERIETLCRLSSTGNINRSAFRLLAAARA
jgi:hypothetical protein